MYKLRRLEKLEILLSTLLELQMLYANGILGKFGSLYPQSDQKTARLCVASEGSFGQNSRE